MVDCPAESLWAKVRSLQFDKMAPSIYQSVQQEQDGLVGQNVKVVFADGATETLRVTGICDKSRCLCYEVSETTPDSIYTSRIGKIKCSPVTETNQCFLSWRTEFSNDADAQVVEDCKYKRREFFKALKASK